MSIEHKLHWFWYIERIRDAPGRIKNFSLGGLAPAKITPKCMLFLRILTINLKFITNCGASTKINIILIWFEGGLSIGLPPPYLTLNWCWSLWLQIVIKSSKSSWRIIRKSKSHKSNVLFTKIHLELLVLKNKFTVYVFEFITYVS